MHLTTLFTLAVSVVSTSASLTARQSLPSCATPCLTQANLNGCQQTDTHCLCTNAVFVSTTTTCIQQSCSGSDLQTALLYSQALCAAVGVTLTASSTATSPASTATSATSTATSATSPSSSSSSSPSATPSSAAAAPYSANAFAGLAVVGLVALVL